LCAPAAPPHRIGGSKGRAYHFPAALAAAGCLEPAAAGAQQPPTAAAAAAAAAAGAAGADSGLTAVTFALHTCSSAPLPGTQLAMYALLSSLSSTDTCAKPAAASSAAFSSAGSAPVTQQAYASAVRSASGSATPAARRTTSEIATRPPGLSTRKASR